MKLYLPKKHSILRLLLILFPFIIYNLALTHSESSEETNENLKYEDNYSPLVICPDGCEDLYVEITGDAMTGDLYMNSSSPYIYFTETDASNQIWEIGGHTGDLKIIDHSDGDTLALVFDSGTQYIGLGTDSPGARLDVRGEGKFDGAISAVDSTGIGLKDDGGNTGVWVEDGGSVGIGTTNPAGDLHVATTYGGSTIQEPGILFYRTGYDAGIELRYQHASHPSTKSTPYIDFSNDDSIDYDGRLRLTDDDTFAFEGASHDYAETIATDDHTLEPADVIVIDNKNIEKVKKSFIPYDKLVAGVYSTAPGIIIGEPINIEKPLIENNNNIPLALAGRVLVKATNENGDIEIGDFLVTSSIPGHVMKCIEYQRCFGSIVGKALEPLITQFGKIKILVTLQ